MDFFRNFVYDFEMGENISISSLYEETGGVPATDFTEKLLLLGEL